MRYSSQIKSISCLKVARLFLDERQALKLPCLSVADDSALQNTRDGMPPCPFHGDLAVWRVI